MGFLLGLFGAFFLHLIRLLTLITIGFAVGALTGIGVTYAYTFVTSQQFELIQGAWMGSILGVVSSFLRYVELINELEG